jgi:hypothetical protein
VTDAELADDQRPDPRSLPPASGYSYLLPGGWLHLATHPGDPARRAAGVRRAVVWRVRREPRLAPHLARLDRLLLHECAVAAASGAERVSLLAEPVDGRVITASVTFAVESLPAAAGPLDAAGISQRLAVDDRIAADGPGDGDRTATQRVVALSQLDAVHRTWSGPPSGTSDRAVVSRLWQLLVPWPGCPRVGVLTMSSPCAPLWPLLGQTFDACAQTFHWTWPVASPASASSPPH